MGDTSQPKKKKLGDNIKNKIDQVKAEIKEKKQQKKEQKEYKKKVANEQRFLKDMEQY